MPKRRESHPLWLTPSFHSENKKKANAHEERVAAVMGGRRVKCSGARPWAEDPRDTEGKDIETDVLVVEHKCTKKKSMSVRREWLEAIAISAERAMKDPAVVLTFEGLDRSPDDWIMMPLSVAVRLLGSRFE